LLAPPDDIRGTSHLPDPPRSLYPHRGGFGSSLAGVPSGRRMTGVQTEKARAVSGVQAALASLAEALDEDQLPDLRRRTELIERLMVPDREFLVEAFITDEVAREMHH
jgi:hypothetical protein